MASAKVSKVINSALIEELMVFLATSPTPYHVAVNLSHMLTEAGFVELQESQVWNAILPQQFFVTRQGSSLIAFRNHAANQLGGVRMMGTHTDSPCLRIKPNPIHHAANLSLCQVEVYGSPLLSTWFDRDLGLAGRIHIQKNDKKYTQLILSEDPLAFIPNLAIHLNRDANKGWAINPQIELNALLGTQIDSVDAWVNGAAGIENAELIDHDLRFFDCQKPQIIGAQREFLTSARLDNLLSTFIAAKALIHSEHQQPTLLAAFDHEEVGSTSATGANGRFLESILQRIYRDDFMPCMAKSLLISLDNAHALHPNYESKHDLVHTPRMNAGVAIKTNVNQRYATSDMTSAWCRWVCGQAKIPLQNFNMRNDMPCGSTIGPLLASQLGIATLDMGCPTLAMHSIREIAGCYDITYLYQTLQLLLGTKELHG